MPTYDYCCEQCHHRFTAMHKIADPTPVCPNCSGAVRKELSAPALHASSGPVKQATAAPASHGCGTGGCGCRH